MGLGRAVLAWTYLAAYGIVRAAAAGNAGQAQEADTMPGGKRTEDMKLEDTKLVDRKSEGTLRSCKVSPLADNQITGTKQVSDSRDTGMAADTDGQEEIDQAGRYSIATGEGIGPEGNCCQAE